MRLPRPAGKARTREALVIGGLPTKAAAVARLGAMAVPFLACMIAAAQIGGFPPRVLPSIQAVEGGRPGLVHLNADGSADLGLMQVNTLWVPVVAHVLGATESRVRDALTNDGCFSIRIAGAILWDYRHARAGDLMHAIGDYHSHTPVLNASYQTLVEHRASVLFGHQE